MSKPKRKREPKPFYKKSHKAWYVQVGKKQHRLAGDDRTKPVWPPDDDAKRLYHKLLSEEVEEESTVEAGDDPTVAGLVDDFITWVKAQVKKEKLAPRTLEWYDEHLQRFAKFMGESLTLSQFKKSHVKKWLEKDYPNAGDNYLNGAVRAVSRVFNWAKDEEIITANPIAKFKRRPSTPRVVWLSDAQWKLVEAELSGHFGDFVRFLYLTGARPFEARTANDSHFDGDCLIFEPEESKGKRARRVILLEGEALKIVKRRAGDGPIFSNQNGKPWTAYSLNCRFRRLRDKLVEKGHTFPVFAYVLRHSFATRALKKGVSRSTVAVWLGHTSTAMVDRVYGHIGEDQDYLRKELRRVNKAG